MPTLPATQVAISGIPNGTHLFMRYILCGGVNSMQYQDTRNLICLFLIVSVHIKVEVYPSVLTVID